MAEITITASNFDSEVLQSDIPVLVDFWASWCYPCKMLAPIIAELADEYAGKVKVGKINIDEEQTLAMRYGVSSIPTVLLFKNGQVAGSSIGFCEKSRLEALLNK